MHLINITGHPSVIFLNTLQFFSSITLLYSNSFVFGSLNKSIKFFKSLSFGRTEKVFFISFNVCFFLEIAILN